MVWCGMEWYGIVWYSINNKIDVLKVFQDFFWNPLSKLIGAIYKTCRFASGYIQFESNR